MNVFSQVDDVPSDYTSSVKLLRQLALLGSGLEIMQTASTRIM